MTIDREDRNFDADGEKYHNVSIEADGVEFSDAIVYNRLTITRDVKDGEVILDDVTVRGDVYIYGGGKNSVIFRDCDIQGDIISDKDTDSRYGDEPVALEFEDDTEIDGDITVRGNTIIRAENGIKLNDVSVQRTLDEDLVIDANMQTLQVNSDCDVRVTSRARIDKVNVISSRNVVFRMEGSSYIGTLDSSSDVVLRGNGTVKTIRTDKNVTKDSGIVNNDQTSTFTAVTGISGIPTTGITGQSLTLSPVVSPSTASYKTVKWTITSNGAGANISGDRVLNATKNGTVTLLATIDNGKALGTAYTQSFTITFSGNVTPPTPTASKVTSITNISNQYSVAKDSSIVLTANVDNKVLNDGEKVVWSVSSSDEEYVDIKVDTTYSQIATIKVMKADASDRKITVTAKVDNGDIGATREITILKQSTTPAEPTLTKITAGSTSIAQGGNTTLTAEGSNLDGKTITWTISGKEKADTKITSATGKQATLQIASDEPTGTNKITVKATVDGGGTGKEATERFTITASGSTNPDATPAANSITLNGVTVNTNNGTASITSDVTIGQEYALTASSDPSGKTVNLSVVNRNLLQMDHKLSASITNGKLIVDVFDKTQQVTSLPQNITIQASVQEAGKANFVAKFTIPLSLPETPTVNNIIVMKDTELLADTNSWQEGNNILIKAFLNPAFPDKTVSLTSDNTNVVEISGNAPNYTVIPKTAGTTKLTASVGNVNKEYTITVTAKKKIESITVNPENDLNSPFAKETNGQPTTFELQANGSNTVTAADKVVWTTSPEGYINIATSTNGGNDQKVTATILKADTTELKTITVTAKLKDVEDITLAKSRNIYITQDTTGEVTGINVNNPTEVTGTNKIYRLEATGNNLYGKTIEWSKTESGNSSEASFSNQVGTTATLTVGIDATISNQITVKAWVQGDQQQANAASTEITVSSIDSQNDELSEDEQQIAPKVAAPQKAAHNMAPQAIAQQPAQNTASQAVQKPYIKDITLPTQQCEAGKDFDLSQAKVETVGENNFVVNWYLMRGFAEIPDSHTVRMDRPGTVTMQAYVEDGAQDGTAYTKDFVITFTEPQQPSEQEQQKLQEEQQKQQEQQKLLEEEQRKQQEQQKLLEEQQKQQEQQKLEEEEQRKQQEQQKLLEEQQKQQEQQKLQEEEQRKQQEQQKLLEEQQKQQEQQKLLEEQQKQQEQQKLLEEQQKQQEQQKLLEEQQKQQEQQKLLEEQQKQQEQQQQIQTTPIQPGQTVPAQPEDTSIIISYMGSVVTNSDIVLYAKKADGKDLQNAVWSIANDGGTMSSIEKNILRATNKGNVIVKVTISNGTGLPKIRTKMITIV